MLDGILFNQLLGGLHLHTYTMQIHLSDNCRPAFLAECEWLDAQAGFICYPWDLSPREYLGFAAADLREAGLRARINAIGNAKRAIHAHVDFLLYNCGRCLKEANFPQKLELLQRLGIIAPAILKRYNRLRNVIEHDYAAPTKEETSEVLDVAELFVEATRMYTRPLPSSMVLQTRDEVQVCKIECHWDEWYLVITANPIPPDSCGTCIVHADKELSLWTEWVAAILKLMHENADPYVKCSESELDG